MPDYDFHQLSPNDVELLVRDLLQAHWKTTIESFKGGRDGGIDLRCARGPDNTVIQVKHYVRTGFKGLLRELKREAIKLEKIQPTRYVLVTSVPLSAANKQQIIDVFNTPILEPSDVLGGNDLNNLLSLYPDVEKSHYKLWLASKAVLDRVLHNAAITNSEFKVTQVYQQARRYVANSAFPKAVETLENEHVVMITGSPGVGKTTLADLLLYQYLEKGHQAVLIERDPREGLELFQADTHQVFYYDDFMGATFAGDHRGASLGNEDKALISFINMIRSSPKSRLILTTRGHVFSQALNRSERLREAGLDELQMTLRMPDYGLTHRAAILYNHVYFSDLEPEFQDQILSNGFYLEIVKHKKFNPRLIDWLSNQRRVKVGTDQYKSFVRNLLNDPSAIWKHAYSHEISESGRSLLLALWSFAGVLAENNKRSCFKSLHEGRSERYHFSIRPEDYRESLYELIDNFIKPTELDGLEVIDPSVLDLMNSVTRETPENAIDVLTNATNFTQVDRVWQFAKNPKNKAVLEEITKNIDNVATKIEKIAVLDRQVRTANGGIAFLAPNYENRIIVLLQIANASCSDLIGSFVPKVFDLLEKEWSCQPASVSNCLALLHTLSNEHPYISTAYKSQMQKAIETALNSSFGYGVSANEFQEIIDMLHVFEDQDAVKQAAKSAYDEYVTGARCHEDLSNCRTSLQCADLIETLKSMASELDLNTSVMISKVELEMIDILDAEDSRADFEYDQWKDQRAVESYNEREMASLFSSLRQDR